MLFLFQVLCIGCFLVFMVPVGCALFPQTCSVSLDRLKAMEPAAYEEVRNKFGQDRMPAVLYFNKGL